jgi:hypothetical protein
MRLVSTSTMSAVPRKPTSGSSAVSVVTGQNRKSRVRVTPNKKPPEGGSSNSSLLIADQSAIKIHTSYLHSIFSH